MCINADESEPATFNNRLLMEKDPHQLLEGILIACFATKATTAYLYLRFEYIRAYQILEAAIEEARAAGHLGKNIYGTGFNLDVWLHRGAGAYICGEETGLIESLEGKRGWPRIKPPFPAIEGAFRKPTVVNNVETLCCVPHIIERGPSWFKSIGTPKSYGPKLYCVSGHVNKQVCVELPLGVTCRALIDEHAGGVWKGRKAKAAVPGGISMGLLSADELDTPLDFESLRKPGCLGLGTAAVTVIDDQTSIVDYLYNTCRFFAHESCGQCTPCREGTGWFYKTMKRIKAGGGRLEDLDIMLHLANNMGIIPGTTICGLADGAAWPIKNAIAKFRPRARRVHSQPPECGRAASRRCKTASRHGDTARRSLRTAAAAGCRCYCSVGTSEQWSATKSTTTGKDGKPYGNIHHQSQRIHDSRGGEAERHSDGAAGGDRHSLLLLAPGLVGRGQLPDVRDRDRHQGRQDR